MIVKIIKTGESLEVNDSYGLRLIEQGVAVAAPAKAKATKTAEAPAPKKGGKSGEV